MNNKSFIFGLIIVVVGLAFLIFRGQKPINISQNQNKINPTLATENKAYEEKENSEGKVTIAVKPLKIARYNSAPGGKENTVFLVSLETHTVELDKDLKNVSAIIDDKGKEYKPISWSGGVGGHHISGDLVFPILPKDTKSVKLTIKGVDNIDRNFSWNL